MLYPISDHPRDYISRRTSCTLMPRRWKPSQLESGVLRVSQRDSRDSSLLTGILGKEGKLEWEEGRLCSHWQCITFSVAAPPYEYDDNIHQSRAQLLSIRRTIPWIMKSSDFCKPWTIQLPRLLIAVKVNPQHNPMTKTSQSQSYSYSYSQWSSNLDPRRLKSIRLPWGKSNCYSSSFSWITPDLPDTLISQTQQTSKERISPDSTQVL